MKYCKDCIHVEVCWFKQGPGAIVIAGACDKFKDRTRFVQLPRAVGDPVYIVGGKYRAGRKEWWINTGKFRLSDLDKIGKTVFLTREEAEKALKERNANGFPQM